MNVISIGRVVGFVPNCLLPKPSLPDSPFPLGGADRPKGFELRPIFGASDLDGFPAPEKIAVARRQGPDRVHVLGQDDPDVDVERTRGASPPHGTTQRVDRVDQQGIPVFEQVGREEVGSAGNPVAAVVGHVRDLGWVEDMAEGAVLFRPTP